MGLFGRSKKKKINDTVVNMSNSDFLSGADFTAKRDDELKLSSVYGCVDTISTTMSKIPFFVMNRFTKEHIDNENLYNLLNMQPYPEANASIMHKLLWIWDLTKGNAYAVINRKPRSFEIESIIPIHPLNVSIQRDDNRKLYYVITLNDKNRTQRIFRYDEIIHLKEFTLDGVVGISPLDYAMYTTNSGLNQEQWQEYFYRNYCRPLDYLKTMTDLSTKQIKKKVPDGKGGIQEVEMSLKDSLREEWRKAHSGDNKFFTAILDNGLEYGTVPQITPEQMEFVNSKEVNVQDIARFFGMGSCMFKLGVGKQTYSSNEQGQICYINETISGRLRQWEQELTLKLLTREQRAKGWVIKGNLNEELRGDTTTRANWYDKMRSMGVYNINEIRAYEDLEDIGELGDVRTIGPNAVPLEKAIEGQTAGQVTPNPINPNKEENPDKTEQSNDEE